MGKIFDLANYKGNKLGTKAENLLRLKEAFINVPGLICLDDTCEQSQLEAYLKKNFPTCQLFSVRSSAGVEDGRDFSFAGQFKTFLNVSLNDVYDKYRECLAYRNSEELKQYCAINHMEAVNFEMHIIVQEMIEADYSGVIFTANPQGILNEMVICIGRGTGNNVVEDKVCTTTYYYHLTDEIYYYERQQDSPLLSEDELKTLVHAGKQVMDILGSNMDIEFAIKEHSLYVLQARHITTLKSNLPPIVLDNSNIVESYPGITLPLTQSFVKEIYYQVFKSCIYRLTGQRHTVEAMDKELKQMVDVANGRIYYRISNWYDVLLLLPFHKRIIPVWQEMLGVEDKTITTACSKKVNCITRLKVTCSFFKLLLTNLRKMKELNGYFDKVLKAFYEQFSSQLDGKALLQLYKTLKDHLAEKWDITLVNDSYTFIYTGLLKHALKKRQAAGSVEEANKYLARFTDIESMRPIEELIHLAVMAKKEKLNEQFKKIDTNDKYFVFLKEAGNEKMKEALEQYRQAYGDRSLEELKLESRTFRTDPVLMIQRIYEYMQDEDLESLLSGNDAKADTDKLSIWSKFCLRQAGMGIVNREKSRLNRSRIFGMTRKIMLALADHLVKQNEIEQQEDIFYLYLQEIERVINGEKIDLKKKVAERKRIYEMYKQLPAYSRLIFAGQIVNKRALDINASTIEENGQYLQGVPAANGIEEGEVLIIEDSHKVIDIKDKILVTQMTDPGWVFLITRAKGIIAEKGSPLSHTAIISRELNKPLVVGVKKVTDLLHNGDRVRINGTNGEISILERNVKDV